MLVDGLAAVRDLARSIYREPEQALRAVEQRAGIVRGNACVAHVGSILRFGPWRLRALRQLGAALEVL
jgi:hypothetical protein